MTQHTLSPISASKDFLRVVRDEDAPPYDGMSAPARAEHRHMTVIDDTALDQVAATCGLAAMGLYAMLERRVGKDGEWTCTLASLALACGQTERHVRDAAKALEDAGFVTRTTVSGPTGMSIGIRWYLPKHLRTYRAEPTPEPGAEPTPEPSRAHVKEISNSQVVTSTPSEERPTKPLPENGTAQQIVAAYCLVARLEQPANYKRAVGQAAQLAKAGVTPEDVPALYEYVSGWAKGADLGLMLNQVDRWRSTKAPPPRAGTNPTNKGGIMKVAL